MLDGRGGNGMFGDGGKWGVGYVRWKDVFGAVI